MRTVISPVLLITAIVCMAGCKKDDPAPPPPTPGGPVDPGPFVMDINGVFGMQLTIDGETVTYTGYDPFPPTNQVGLVDNPTQGRYFTSGLFDGDVLMMGIRIGTLFHPHAELVSDSLLQTFLAPGDRIIAPASTGLQGVEVHYTDSEGISWSSALNGTVQPGANFHIEQVQTEPNPKGVFVRFKATISNCTLYNSEGNSITVSGGGAVFELGDYY